MKFKVIIPVVASVLALVSCRGGNNPTTGGTTGGTSSGGDVGTVSKTDFNGYYANYADDLNAHISATIQFDLHKLCLDTHRNVVKYSQFASFDSKSASPRPIDDNGKGGLQMFYTGKDVPYGNIGTREHVWPCANSAGLWQHEKSAGTYYVDGTNYWGGGSDLYHVRPSTSAVNTARGNGKFYEFQAGQTFYEHTDGGPYSLRTDTPKEFANKAEPADDMKGDVARILMYVFVHYSKMGTYNWYYDAAQTQCVMGNLSLRQVFAYDDMDTIYAIMVKWNALDPVSQVEKDRNDTIQQIQGNRNPFVDYPHLMAKCFGL